MSASARRRTFLPSIVPVRVDEHEVDLAEACHQRDFPEDSLKPETSSLDLKVAEVAVMLGRDEADGDLVRVEAELLEVVEVRMVKVRAGDFEPVALGVGQPEGAKLWRWGVSEETGAGKGDGLATASRKASTARRGKGTSLSRWVKR